MRKRDRNETEEERKARKRAKKEAKKKDKERNEKEKQSRDSLSSIKAEPPTPRAPKAQDEDVMVDERPGHFQQKRVRMIVSVFPSALRDLKRHINESLQNLLLRYVDGLDGVLLAFDSVSIGGKDSPHGMILNEQPQVHCSVEFDALLFCPTIGSKLRGVVNECFPSHVGMLVYDFFNAIVSAEHLEKAGYSHDRDSQQWESSETILAYEDTVEFTTVKLHECAGIISMEGSDPSIANPPA